MSANINEDRIVTVGETWHGIGTVVNQALTAKEAIEMGKSDIPLELIPDGGYYNGEWINNPGKYHIVRSDTKQILSENVVNENYQIFQNVEAFNFFDSLVQTKEAIYHTTGILGKGEIIFISAKLPNSIVVKGVDLIDKYLLLTNWHTGNRALKAFFTPTRVVCQNTLNMALRGEHTKGISIRHTGDLKLKVKEAQRILGISIKYYEDLGEVFNGMADYKINYSQVKDYFNRVLDVKEESEKESSQLKNTRNKLEYLFQNGKGNSESRIKDSLFAAYNAVTEFSDFYKTVKGGKLEDRVKSSFFGSGGRLKQKAYNEAFTLLTK